LKVIGSVAEQTGDVTAPSTPGSLTATTVSATRIDLAWTASTDNVAVTGYQIFRDGSPIATTTQTSYSSLSLSPSTQYSYEVSAYDAAGNNSPNAGPALATTDANSAPVWALGNQSGETGGAVNIDLDSVCSDSDGDTITYSLQSGTLPAGLALSGARNQTLSGTLSEVDVDNFTLRASDGITSTDVAITFTVTAPDTTAPAVPTGLAAGTTTQSVVPLSWDTNSESDFSYYSVYRSTDDSNFGKVTTDGEQTTTSLSDTGRNAETTYYYRVTATDDSGNESAQSSSVSATTQVFGANPYDLTTIAHTNSGQGVAAGDPRTPPAWVTDGTFQWAAEPQNISQFETVTTMAQLQSFAGNSQIQITIDPSFGSQSGSVDFTGQDMRIIANDSVTINGDISIGPRGSGSTSRIHWSGGNCNGEFEFRRGDDYIIDDMFCDSIGSGMDSAGIPYGGRRIVVMNSTFRVFSVPENNWAIHNTASPPGGLWSDWLLANCYYAGAAPSGQTHRLNNIVRLIHVDCTFNPEHLNTFGIRTHMECQYVWFADSVVVRQWNAAPEPDGTTGPDWLYSIDRGLVERCDFYGNSSSAIVNNGVWGSNGMTIQSCRQYNIAGSTSTPFTSGASGSGNVAAAWDGSAAQVNSNSGDQSQRGAQR
jgi:fibronectin type 3 domain-containing protein